MIPLRDRNPSRTFPVVTVALVVINVLIFLYQVLFVNDLEAFFYTHGLVPCALTGQCQAPPGSLAPWQTLFTSMFLHGSWLHVGGNMLYLWIFGNNVEDEIGHIGYLIFYFLCGLVAGFAQIAIDPGSTVVNIGASGAIAGVLGAYLILYPRAQVDTLVFLGFFINIVALPAILVLGLWFVLQLFSGVTSLGVQTSGGVAFFAHVGGFIAGILLLFIFRRRGNPRSYSY